MPSCTERTSSAEHHAVLSTSSHGKSSLLRGGVPLARLACWSHVSCGGGIPHLRVPIVPGGRDRKPILAFIPTLLSRFQPVRADLSIEPIHGSSRASIHHNRKDLDVWADSTLERPAAFGAADPSIGPIRDSSRASIHDSLKDVDVWADSTRESPRPSRAN